MEALIILNRISSLGSVESDKYFMYNLLESKIQSISFQSNITNLSASSQEHKTGDFIVPGCRYFL